MVPYRSRPRAICIDLVKTLLTEDQAVPDTVLIARKHSASGGFHLSRRGAEIWQAAGDAGLPTVVVTDLSGPQLDTAIEALPCDPDLVVVSEAADTNDDRSVALERVARDLRMNATDILYVGDAKGSDITAPHSVGMRTCAGDEAVRQVQLLDNRRRCQLLSYNFSDDVELVHTVLLPLDLSVGEAGDLEFLRRHSHFVFDTVLIVEGLVATSGFGMKAIEKAAAGNSLILYSAAGFDETLDLAEIVRERLHRMKHGGAERLILVHAENREEADHHNIVAIAEHLGYEVELRTWKTLMSQFEQDHICKT